MKVAQLLSLWGLWQRQVCRDMNCLLRRSYVLIRVFIRASCGWQSEGLFGQSFSVAPPVQALRGFPCLGSFSVVRCIRHIEGPPGWSPTRRSALQSLKGATWVGSYSVVQCIRCLMDQPLYCSAEDAGGGEREAMVMAPPPSVTQQYRLASMAAWLSSTSISHHNLLPHIPSIHLSAVNTSPRPGIAPQSLNSSSQLLHLPGHLCPCPGYVWLQQGLSDSFHLG